MRYNPCGRIVDISRRPYTTVFRPWEGSTEEVELVWYVVPWSNPVLGMPSRIQSLDQCSFPWAASGVGEVYNAPRLYNGQWDKPWVDGSHVCGTPADFAGHSIKDEELPEVVYNEADLPMCCVPPFIGSGGAVASGTADVEVVAASYCLSYQNSGGGEPTGLMTHETSDPYTWTRSIGGGGAIGVTAPEGAGGVAWYFAWVFSSLFWVWEAPASWDGHGSQLFTFSFGSSTLPDTTITCAD